MSFTLLQWSYLPANVQGITYADFHHFQIGMEVVHDRHVTITK